MTNEATRVLKLARARDLAVSGRGKEIRQRHRLSLPDIGTAIGAVHTTVMRWERGERRPTGDPAIRWVELLDQLDHQAAEVSV